VSRGVIAALSLAGVVVVFTVLVVVVFTVLVAVVVTVLVVLVVTVLLGALGRGGMREDCGLGNGGQRGCSTVLLLTGLGHSCT
jgi:hypothetical protein